MRLSPVLCAVTVLLTGTLAAACSAGADPPPPADVRAALRLIADQPGELGRAEAVATQRCLRAKGFDAPAPAADAGAVQNLPVHVDERAAAVAGYGDRIPRGARATGAAMDRYAESLPESGRGRLDRTLGNRAAARARFTTPNGWEFRAPRDGCVAAGRAAVYGSVDNWLVAYYLPQDLNRVAADAYLDRQVAAASAAYQRCMAEGGYRVLTPQDAVESARDRRAATDRVPAGELALATTDAGCQRRSRVVEIWYAEFERRADPWLARSTAQVTRAAEVVRAATARASAQRATPVASTFS